MAVVLTLASAWAGGAGRPGPAAPAPAAHAPASAGRAEQPAWTRAAVQRKRCHTGYKLVPTCGILWGVAPGARTEDHGFDALADFERKTGRHQAVFHGYHHGIR